MGGCNGNDGEGDGQEMAVMIAANGVVGGSNPLNAAGGILHYHIDAVTGITQCGCMLGPDIIREIRRQVFDSQ